MKVINSITNGNWSSSDIWDNGVPNLNDVVYINHILNLDIDSSTILNLYITTNGILNCANGKNLNSSNITIIGGQILCDEFSVITCTTLTSVNMEENVDEDMDENI